MEDLMNDIERLYEIKCNKYKEEDLTPEFRQLLYEEAVNEVGMMNYINSVGMKNYQNKGGKVPVTKEV